jgi:hypothetical protein
MEPRTLSNLSELRAEFDRCWPWLEKSNKEFGPTHTKEQIWQRIVYGKAFLWPAADAAILGEFIDHPIGIRSFNYWLQGGHLPTLQKMWPGVEDWAIRHGCEWAIGDGREGWTSVMQGDWRRTRVVRRKRLVPREARHVA